MYVSKYAILNERIYMYLTKGSIPAYLFWCNRQCWKSNSAYWSDLRTANAILPINLSGSLARQPQPSLTNNQCFRHSFFPPYKLLLNSNRMVRSRETSELQSVNQWHEYRLGEINTALPTCTLGTPEPPTYRRQWGTLPHETTQSVNVPVSSVFIRLY